VTSIVPITEPARRYLGSRPAVYRERPTVYNDPDLTPTVPGVTDQDSIDDWDTPFPRTRETNSTDDEYWNNYRLTPKAFLPLPEGQRLFSSRFGNTTGLKIDVSAAKDLQALNQTLRSLLLPRREDLGWSVIPIRDQQLAASSGTTPFDGLFLALSFFVIVAAMGPSGSGKSTLLNLLGCLDKPTNGSLLLGEDDIASMTDDELAEIRSERIGFVFQSYNLIQQLTVVENIQVPLFYQGKIGAKENERAMMLAERVGLQDRLDHRPAQLSGGQQQRVAIARSLINDPYFVLADEATGNLDSITTEEILTLFEELNSEGRTIIMVTHEDDVAQRARRVVRLKDGMLHSDTVNTEQERDEARTRQRENVEILKRRED